MYRRAAMQSGRLRGGTMSYKAFDRGQRHLGRSAAAHRHALRLRCLPLPYAHHRPYMYSTGGDERWVLAHLEAREGFVVQNTRRR